MIQLPNGPTRSPWLQLIDWVIRPLDYMESCARDHQDIFTARFGKRTIVMVNHPQAMQEMLTGNAFEAPGERNDIVRPLVGDNSMLLLSGDRHKKRRKLLMPPFHGERMRNYGQIICTIAEKVANEWATGQSFIARDSMQEITMRVILRAVFGLDEGPRLEKIKELLATRLNMTGNLLGAMVIFFPFLQKDLGPWSPWGRIRQKQRQIDELLYAEIADRRANPDPDRTDILSLLLSARDEEGKGMSDIELRDELITLLVAGHETTATTLAWALYWIHLLPEVKEKLLEELDTLPENPEPMDIFRLPYLTAVCNETLRIYPVAMLTFPRVPRSPVELMGNQLEPGVTVIGLIYLTHHREDLYPEPKKFKPERFLDRQFSPYEFIPFGAGDRRCIGMALAQFEMKLVLATILLKTDLGLANSQPVKPERRGVLLAPKGGIEMVMKGSRNPSKSKLMAV